MKKKTVQSQLTNLMKKSEGWVVYSGQFAFPLRTNIDLKVMEWCVICNLLRQYTVYVMVLFYCISCFILINLQYVSICTCFLSLCSSCSLYSCLCVIYSLFPVLLSYVPSLWFLFSLLSVSAFVPILYILFWLVIIH